MFVFHLIVLGVILFTHIQFIKSDSVYMFILILLLIQLTSLFMNKNNVLEHFSELVRIKPILIEPVKNILSLPKKMENEIMPGLNTLSKMTSTTTPDVNEDQKEGDVKEGDDDGDAIRLDPGKYNKEDILAYKHLDYFFEKMKDEYPEAFKEIQN
jgi:hypothetical protein